MQQNDLPFTAQRLVCFLPVVGGFAFAIVVLVILQTNDGQGFAAQPIAHLEPIVVAVGSMLLVGSLVLRSLLHRRADAAEAGRARSLARFRARLVPIVLLEGGALFGTIAFLLSGRAIPHLMVVLALILVQIVLLPVRDVDDKGLGGVRDRGQRT